MLFGKSLGVIVAIDRGGTQLLRVCHRLLARVAGLPFAAETIYPIELRCPHGPNLPFRGTHCRVRNDKIIALKSVDFVWNGA